MAAHLLSLQPWKNTTSWLERNSRLVGDNLRDLSNVAEPMSMTAANIFKVFALMSNFVGSGEQNAKNRFICHFLDEKKKCCATEWNINRGVLEQFGPLLRGSIVLAFHGTGKRSNAITLLLRSRLRHRKISNVDCLPPGF
jgi:hypothetical protein